jgi:hypothetical protein
MGGLRFDRCQNACRNVPQHFAVSRREVLSTFISVSQLAEGGSRFRWLYASGAICSCQLWLRREKLRRKPLANGPSLFSTQSLRVLNTPGSAARGYMASCRSLADRRDKPRRGALRSIVFACQLWLRRDKLDRSLERWGRRAGEECCYSSCNKSLRRSLVFARACSARH